MSYFPTHLPFAENASTASHAESIGTPLRGMGQAYGDRFNPVANLAVYIPLIVPEVVTVLKMWWRNGANATGNVDVGLYKEDGTYLISSGSTAQTPAGAEQSFDITDTVLTPGRYFMALASSSTSARFVAFAPNPASLSQAMGVLEETSALPLPTTSATFVKPANTYVPVIGLSLRTSV